MEKLSRSEEEEDIKISNQVYHLKLNYFEKSERILSVSVFVLLIISHELFLQRQKWTLYNKFDLIGFKGFVFRFVNDILLENMFTANENFSRQEY